MRKPEGEAVRIRKSALRRGLGLALALTMLLPLTGPAVVADSRAAELELDGLKGDASELDSQRREIQAQLKSVQADKDNAMTRKELLEQQIDVIQQQVGNIDDQITMYGQLIEQKTEELAQAEAAEAEQYELFQRRVRYMEEQGDISYWNVLFSSSDFAELVDNYMMVEEIVQYDHRVVDDLTALQEQVRTDRAALEESRTEREVARQRQVAAREELKDQQDEVDRLIEEIGGQEDQLEAMEAELNKAARELDKKIKEIERELAPEIANVASESGFLWPLDGGINTLSSFYGARKDPFTGKARNHTGIDVPAVRDTPIYAAKSGVVTTSELGSGGSWSYGNYVVVSHSDGTSTLYAHMNSRAVSKGQTVAQGEVIGYVGTTGRSTGNHLHFEVRVNGDRVDPLDYFQDKPLYYRSGGSTTGVWSWM